MNSRPARSLLTREIARQITPRVFCNKPHNIITKTVMLNSNNNHHHHNPNRTMATASSTSAFRTSIPLYEQIKVKVPTMGDSITEGTIVEWAAGVGETVKEGDVVVLVETDKVTIDIKADFDGVITNQYGAIDDTVEVGADLYQIDTEGTAAALNDEAPAATATATTTAASSNDTQTNNNNKNHGRIPSIQFLGKEGWKKKLSIVGESSSQPATPPPPPAHHQPMKSHGSIIVGSGAIPPTYGRLPFSEREMEALILGGASEAPLFDD